MYLLLSKEHFGPEKIAELYREELTELRYLQTVRPSDPVPF